MNRNYEEGQRLEIKVYEGLRLLGYEATQNMLIEGHQIDVFYIEKDAWGFNRRHIVECKSQNQKVNKNQVLHFAEVINDLRGKGKADLGEMISKSGFTNDAIKFARKKGISLITQKQFEERTSVIKNTLKRIDEKYSKLEKSQPLLMPISWKSPSSKGDDIFSYLKEVFLRKKGLSFVFLVGNTGSGKTTVLTQIAKHQAQCFRRISNIQNMQSELFPIFVELKELSQNFDIEDIIKWVSESWRYPHVDAMEEIKLALDRGQVLFLLDGLDEIVMSFSFRTLKRIFNALLGLIQKNALVLLTCRKRYFETYQKSESDFFEENSDKIEIISFEDFDDSKIEGFVTGWCKKINKPDLIKYCQDTIYGLRELAKTPLHAAMILDELCPMNPQIRSSVLPPSLNRPQLYKRYINRYIETGKIRLGEENLALLGNLTKICEDYAYEKYQHGKSLKEDCRETKIARTILDEQLTHYSFIEYLVAKRLADNIENAGGPDPSPGSIKRLNETYFSDAVFNFLTEICEEEKYYSPLKVLYKNIKLPPQVRVNVGNTFRKAGKGKISLEEYREVFQKILTNKEENLRVAGYAAENLYTRLEDEKGYELFFKLLEEKKSKGYFNKHNSVKEYDWVNLTGKFWGVEPYIEFVSESKISKKFFEYLGSDDYNDEYLQWYLLSALSRTSNINTFLSSEVISSLKRFTNNEHLSPYLIKIIKHALKSPLDKSVISKIKRYILEPLDNAYSNYILHTEENFFSYEAYTKVKDLIKFTSEA